MHKILQMQKKTNKKYDKKLNFKFLSESFDVEIWVDFLI